MKKLLIMRHAKTEAQDIFGSDFVRNLTSNGAVQAQIQARFISILPFVPELILVSPSNRTQQTLAEMTPILDWPNTEIKTKDKLYHASRTQLLKILSEVDDSIDRVMLIGHNFGLLELVQHFSTSFIPKYKTGSLALFHFNDQSWNTISSETAELIYLKAPMDE